MYNGLCGVCEVNEVLSASLFYYSLLLLLLLLKPVGRQEQFHQGLVWFRWRSRG